MAINTTVTGKTVTLAVAGKIDEKAAEDLKAAFEELELASFEEVIFEFSDVSRIGSAGLGKMLLFYKKLAALGCKMTVSNPPGHIRDLMVELNLNTLFTIN